MGRPRELLTGFVVFLTRMDQDGSDPSKEAGRAGQALLDGACEGLTKSRLVHHNILHAALHHDV